jgi:hypothetical protein
MNIDTKNLQDEASKEDTTLTCRRSGKPEPELGFHPKDH